MNQVTSPCPFRDRNSSVGEYFTQSIRLQNLTILALAVPEISLGLQKFEVGHVIPTTSLLRVIRPPYAGT